MQNTPLKSLGVLVSVMAVFTVLAGTLDNAPFRVVLPGRDWTLHDTTAQDCGKNVFLVASITSTDTQSKSVVIKTASAGTPAAAALDELCAGIRDQFSNPAVKKLADEETMFLGYRARRFTYEVNGTTYNEAVVFVAGDTGWTIACAGVLDQKTEIKKLFTFYQKKEK